MSERAPAGFLDGVFDRTLANLRSAWREIALSARGVLSGAPRPDLPEDDAARLRQQMLSCLDGRGGEVTARARAAELGRSYLALNEAGRGRFLRLLASEFDTDHDAVDRCCAGLAAVDTTAERIAAERALRAALLPPRVTLLRQFNALPEGVKFLVDRRAELIAIANGDLVLRGLADDLRDLLANWFDIGFLELQRITWDAPASLLEKLMAYEAVHEIRGWTDLKNRLEADRRCFAFFHPRMPDEPLIFVEVALVSGIAGNIHALLDEAAPIGNPQAADTAIFYSISNCQRGLLLRLGARYLLQARGPSGRARDPVAHFHLSNGARVEQLNWLGDVSEKGLQQSAGMMVNYLYRLGDIEANHEAYRDEGRVAAASAGRNLLRAG